MGKNREKCGKTVKNWGKWGKVGKKGKKWENRKKQGKAKKMDTQVEMGVNGKNGGKH